MPARSAIDGANLVDPGGSPGRSGPTGEAVAEKMACLLADMHEEKPLQIMGPTNDS